MKVLLAGGPSRIDPIRGAGRQLDRLSVHAVPLTADAAVTIDRERPDIVAIVSADPDGCRRWTSAARRAGNGAVVWGAFDDGPGQIEDARPEGRAYGPDFADALRTCLYVAATSHEAEAIGARGVAAERIFVIGPAVEAPLDAPAIVTGEPTVVVAGDADATMLGAALQRVWQRAPAVRVLVTAVEVRKRLIGVVPPDRLAQIDEAPGPLRDAAARSSAVVCLENGDAPVIAAIEGWAVGRPAIGWRRGALASLVEEGLDGLLVEPGQAGALAVAIRDLACDLPRAREMGAAGHSRALVRHTRARVAEQLTQVFVMAQQMAGAAMSRPT
jgi:hypothetical protein